MSNKGSTIQLLRRGDRSYSSGAPSLGFSHRPKWKWFCNVNEHSVGGKQSAVTWMPRNILF